MYVRKGIAFFGIGGNIDHEHDHGKSRSAASEVGPTSTPISSHEGQVVVTGNQAKQQTNEVNMNALNIGSVGVASDSDTPPPRPPPIQSMMNAMQTQIIMI